MYVAKRKRDMMKHCNVGGHKPHLRRSFALKLSFCCVVPISRFSNRRSENILKQDFAILFPLQPSNKFAAPHCVPYYIPNSLKYIGLLCRQLNSRIFFYVAQIHHLVKMSTLSPPGERFT